MSKSRFYGPSSEENRHRVEDVRNQRRIDQLNSRRRAHGLPPITSHLDLPIESQPQHRDQVDQFIR